MVNKRLRVPKLWCRTTVTNRACFKKKSWLHISTKRFPSWLVWLVFPWKFPFISSAKNSDDHSLVIHPKSSYYQYFFQTFHNKTPYSSLIFHFHPSKILMTCFLVVNTKYGYCFQLFHCKSTHSSLHIFFHHCTFLHHCTLKHALVTNSMVFQYYMRCMILMHLRQNFVQLSFKVCGSYCKCRFSSSCHGPDWRPRGAGSGPRAVV